MYTYINIYSVEGHSPLTDFFVIYKRSVCIKFLQIIVIFPESPQTFTWSESQNPGGTLNVDVIGMLVGDVFWKTLKKYTDSDLKVLKSTEIAGAIPYKMQILLKTFWKLLIFTRYGK